MSRKKIAPPPPEAAEQIEFEELQKELFLSITPEEQREHLITLRAQVLGKIITPEQFQQATGQAYQQMPVIAFTIREGDGEDTSYSDYCYKCANTGLDIDRHITEDDLVDPEMDVCCQCGILLKTLTEVRLQELAAEAQTAESLEDPPVDKDDFDPISTTLTCKVKGVDLGEYHTHEIKLSTSVCMADLKVFYGLHSAGMLHLFGREIYADQVRLKPGGRKCRLEFKGDNGIITLTISAQLGRATVGESSIDVTDLVPIVLPFTVKVEKELESVVLPALATMIGSHQTIIFSDLGAAQVELPLDITEGDGRQLSFTNPSEKDERDIALLTILREMEELGVGVDEWTINEAGDYRAVTLTAQRLTDNPELEEYLNTLPIQPTGLVANATPQDEGDVLVELTLSEPAVESDPPQETAAQPEPLDTPTIRVLRMDLILCHSTLRTLLEEAETSGRIEFQRDEDPAGWANVYAYDANILEHIDQQYAKIKRNLSAGAKPPKAPYPMSFKSTMIPEGFMDIIDELEGNEKIQLAEHQPTGFICIKILSDQEAISQRLYELYNGFTDSPTDR